MFGLLGDFLHAVERLVVMNCIVGRQLGHMSYKAVFLVEVVAHVLGYADDWIRPYTR